jgi:Zn-dependent peptidase ImmA (M78 family)
MKTPKIKFKRGFKSWAEKKSQELRKSLSLSIYSELDSKRLAQFLSIKVLPLDEIPQIPKAIVEMLSREKEFAFSGCFLINKKGEKIIIYNHKHSIARIQSTVMHEIAHFICGHHEENQNKNKCNIPLLAREYNESHENEANWLGGCLCFPQCAVYANLKHNKTMSQICNQYMISQDMFNYRVSVTGARKRYKVKVA